MKRKPASRPSASEPTANAIAPTLQPTITLMKVSWMSSRENSEAVGSSVFSSSFVVCDSSRSETGRDESFMLLKSFASPESESAVSAARLASRVVAASTVAQLAANCMDGEARARPARGGARGGACGSTSSESVAQVWIRSTMESVCSQVRNRLEVTAVNDSL